MDLLIDQSIAQIEQALADTLTLALKVRLLPVADLPTLRATPTVGASGGPARTDGDLIYVTNQANAYRWSQMSRATDDDATVIQPADVRGTGRWLRAASTLFGGTNIATIQAGFLKDVVLHNGDFSDDTIKARIYGQAPCVAIHFAGEEHKAISQIPGALYDYRVRFEIWSVSRNYRDGSEAAIGSLIPSELASDPSVMRIHGAVKRLLAGQDLGQPGIKYIEIGAGNLEEADEVERIFVMSLGIEVRGSIHNPDAPAELGAVSGINLQKSIASASDQRTFDPSNCIAAGLDVPLGTGFTKTISAGSAYVAGTLVNVVATVATFIPNAVTYRDLHPDGTWSFAAVSFGGDAPAVAPGALRVGATATDAVGVVEDHFIASMSEPYGGPDQIAL
jgi:phage gp37-like protein